MNNHSCCSSCRSDKRQDPLVAYLVRFITDTFGFNSALPALLTHSLWTSGREAAASCTFLQSKVSTNRKYHLPHGFSQAKKSRIKVLVNSIIGRWSRLLPREHYCLVGQMWGLEKLCGVILDPAEDAVARIPAMETPVTVWTGIDYPVGKIGYPKSALLYDKVSIN